MKNDEHWEKKKEYIILKTYFNLDKVLIFKQYLRLKKKFESKMLLNRTS